MCSSQVLVMRRTMSGTQFNTAAFYFWFLFVLWLLVSDSPQTLNKLSSFKKKLI